jgi:DNA-binding transcriptional LysR family regulator
VLVDTSRLLVEQLRKGELDLVIGRVLDSESAAQLSFEPLTDEPHTLVARTGHPLAGREDLRLPDLAQLGWILPPAGSILRDRLTALFLSAGLDQPQQTVETLSLPVITALLGQSDMVSAVPTELVQPYVDAGLLTELAFDLGLRMDAYGIVTRGGHQLSPGAELMLGCLRDEARRRQLGRLAGG